MSFDNLIFCLVEKNKMRFKQGFLEFLCGIEKEVPDSNISKVEHLLPGDTYWVEAGMPVRVTGKDGNITKGFIDPESCPVEIKCR